LINLLYVGFIKKTHGFKGAVKIIIENTEISFIETEPLMLEINKKPVPFFIEDISRKDTEWLVKFEDIQTVEEAEEIVGLSIFIESDEDNADQFWSNNTVGFKIIDEHLGPIGIVIEHLERPGQDLLEVEYNGKNFYLPFAHGIITGHDSEKQILYSNIPDGLIEINN